MSLNYERLKYFLQAAKTENFSEAARQLHISPQAFGKQINRFEEEIGMKLFLRTGYRKKLTPEGEIVYRHMSQLIESIENEYEILRLMGNKNRSSLNVGLLTFLPRDAFITPVMAELMRCYEDKNLNFKILEMPQLGEALHNQELDFAITLVPDITYGWEGYEHIVLDSRIAKIAISMYHPLVIQNHLTLEDLQGMSKVRFDFPLDLSEDPYPGYPCRDERIVDNYATLLSRLEQENAYGIVVPEWSNLKKEYHITYFDMPVNPMLFHIILLYRSSLKSTSLSSMLEDIQDYFET